MNTIEQAAAQFVAEEKAFHLGALPTEQPHPGTKGLSGVTARNTSEGLAMLQRVDQDVLATARRVFASPEYGALVAALATAITDGRRVCFSGCGATGRLSILLEAAYRAFWREARERVGAALDTPTCRRAADAVISIMTGGDYALIRSVESFEDYTTFGRQQVIEAGLGPGDVLVAITEGGETSSVIGTAWQALESGARVFFACNNPLDVLARVVELSRRVIEEPRIVKLDLSTGPMALAGSTRLQATTSELLIVGAALEEVVRRFARTHCPKAIVGRPGVPEANGDATARFEALLTDLSAPAAVAAMARWVEMEERLYRGGGAITYFSDAFVLDIFTDTTERAPTFSWPPFRRCDDTVSPRPLCFVKNPRHDTDATWRGMLGRDLRCLAWDPAMYQRLGASEQIMRKPPALSRADAMKFLIGNEEDVTRFSGPGDCAACVLNGASADDGAELAAAAAAAARRFPTRAMLAIGAAPDKPWTDGAYVHVPCGLAASPLRLWEHLAIKLVLNTISTATATRLGRVSGNWMSYVETTNKKLIDRATRLVVDLGGLDYAAACREVHLSMAEITARPVVNGERLSPVAVTLERLGRMRM